MTGLSLVLALLNAAVTAAAVDCNNAPTLVGAHYFGGWYECGDLPRARCFPHWAGFTAGAGAAPTNDWRPSFPGRVPLLGNSSLDEATIAAEVAAADQHGLDFFDVLVYDAGATGADIPACAHPVQDPLLGRCLNTALAWMLNSSAVWTGVSRMHFFLTYSNDVDRSRKGMFVGATGRALWSSYVRTFVRAFAHPRYLHVAGRPVFKVLIPEVFLNVQCSGNATLANTLLHELRAAATEAGESGHKGAMVGGGWHNPSVPAVPQAQPRPHPRGYMRYNTTSVACAGGCSLGGQQPVIVPIGPAGAVEAETLCGTRCNSTAACTAFELSRPTTPRVAVDAQTLFCQLLSAAGPGAPNASTDTFVRVSGEVAYDFTGTYNSAPPVCPGQPDWVCARYKHAWQPNATTTGARIFPFVEMANYQAAARGNHTHDPVPYVASVIAGFDPRPWQEHAPSFATPTAAEWEASLRQVKAVVEAPGANFGFPCSSGGDGDGDGDSVQPALTIYAWNELGEGGILVPTRGEGWMKLQSIARVFGRNVSFAVASAK